MVVDAKADRGYIYGMSDLDPVRELMKRERYSIAHLARLLGMTQGNLATKFNRGLMRFGLVKRILDIMGYDIVFKKRK